MRAVCIITSALFGLFCGVVCGDPGELKAGAFVSFRGGEKTDVELVELAGLVLPDATAEIVTLNAGGTVIGEGLSAAVLVNGKALADAVNELIGTDIKSLPVEAGFMVSRSFDVDGTGRDAWDYGFVFIPISIRF